MASQLLPVQENIGESLLNIGYIFILVYYVYFYIFPFIFAFFFCLFLFSSFFFVCFFVVSLSASFLSVSRAFSFPVSSHVFIVT